MALQTITAVGDSGTIAAAAIILAADPTDLASTGGSGTIDAAAVVEAYEHSETFLPAADTYIASIAAANNYGENDTLVVGINYTSLLKFDLSAIPQEWPVYFAKLVLTRVAATSSAQSTYVRRLLKDWGEGSGNGVPAVDGEADYTYAVRTSSAWATAGAKSTADRSSTNSASLSSSNTVLGPVELLDLSTDVRNWVTGTNPNYGWALQGSSSTDSYRTIYGSSDNLTEGVQPMLVVWTDPLPSIPDAPTDVTGVLSGTDIVVSWTDVATDEVGYKYKVAYDGGDFGPEVTIPSSENATGVTLTPVAGWATAIISVASYNAFTSSTFVDSNLVTSVISLESVSAAGTIDVSAVVLAGDPIDIAAVIGTGTIDAHIQTLRGGIDIYPNDLDVLLDMPQGMAWYINGETGIGVYFGPDNIVDGMN